MSKHPSTLGDCGAGLAECRSVRAGVRRSLSIDRGCGARGGLAVWRAWAPQGSNTAPSGAQSQTATARRRGGLRTRRSTSSCGSLRQPGRVQRASDDPPDRIAARRGERSSVNAAHTLPPHARRATAAAFVARPSRLRRNAAPRPRPPPAPRTATPRRPLGRRTAGRHHSRIRIRPAAGVPRPRERGQGPQGRRVRPAAAAAPTAAGATTPAAPSN